MLLSVSPSDSQEVDTKRLNKIPTAYRKEIEKKLNAISELIQARREKLGLTQEELAEELGISVMTLQFIEQRRRYPSLPLLFFILRYLKMDITITE